MALLLSEEKIAVVSKWKQTSPGFHFADCFYEILSRVWNSSLLVTKIVTSIQENDRSANNSRITIPPRTGTVELLAS